MSVAAAQAAAFFAEVKDEAAVWAIKDENGFPAPLNQDGARAMPFWSKESRALRIIQSVQAYSGFSTHRLTLDEFQTRWLPGLSRDGLLVGLNWSGESATGYDQSADEVLAKLTT